MKKIWKDNSKLIIAIVVTIVLASGATYAATTMYDSNTVSYDNTTSGLRSTNVQSALDELYGCATNYAEVNDIIGSGILSTTSKTLIGAVNELNSSKLTIQSVNRNGNTDNKGNLWLNVDNAKFVSFAANSDSYDGLYTVFYSSVQQAWYVHVSDFESVSKPYVAISGVVYLIQ